MITTPLDLITLVNPLLWLSATDNDENYIDNDEDDIDNDGVKGRCSKW